MYQPKRRVKIHPFHNKYAKDTSLYGNENHLLALLQNQTSVMEATMNMIKHDESQMEKQSYHINMLMDMMRKNQDLVEAEQSFNDALLYISHVITECEQQLDAIWEVTANLGGDSAHAHINHALITPSQIKKQAELITRHLNSKLLIPSGMEVYRLGLVYGYKVAKQFIF